MLFNIPKSPHRDFILNYAPIFANLTNGQKSLINRKSEIVNYKKGELIYQRGNSCDAFYCIVSGRVRIFKKCPAGIDETLEFLTSGMYFGITSLLTTQPHSVNSQAFNDTCILKISKEDFDFILEKIPSLAIDLSKTLSLQIRRRDYPRDVLKSNIVSIYSSTRGVGRTIYAVNLAISLKKETKNKVILVDVSESGRELREALGIDSKKQSDSSLVKNNFVFGKSVSSNGTNFPLWQREVLSQCIVHEESSGIDFLDIAEAFYQGISSEQISALLTILTNDYQYVLVDLALDASMSTFKILTESDAIHIMTDYQRVNLENSRKLMADLFRQVDYPQNKIKVILNDRKNFPKLPHNEVIALLNHDIFSSLPLFEEEINARAVKLALVDPGCEYSKSIRRISRDIGGVLVGLALGSGAAFGLAHIGVIKVLERENIPIDMVAGSSMGALIGALWAAGKSGKEIESIMMEYNRDKIKVAQLLGDVCFSKASLVKGRGVRRFLKKHLGERTFWDVRLPFKVLAYDLDASKKMVLEEGTLTEAVMASCAIPGVFKPSQKGHNLVIDGGIIEPVPVETLLNLGAKKIIAINVFPTSQEIQEGYRKYRALLEEERISVQGKDILTRILYRTRSFLKRLLFPNIFDIMAKSLQAMEYVIAEENCRRANVVIHPTLSEVNWFEFFKVDVLIKQGEIETEKALKQIKELVG